MISICRALQFNAQPLPIPGLPPGTALLTVLPQTLARVNHSCSPNAVLTYGVRQAATSSSSSSSSLKSRSSTILNGDPEGGLMKSENDRQIVVWLTSLRQIFPGEEICVSYLYQLCSPHIARREMLQGAFHFNCRCVRCVRESVDVPHSNKWEEGKIDMIGIKERKAIKPIEVDSSLSSLSTSLSNSKVTSEDPDDGLQTFLTSILEKAARRKSQGTGQSDSGDHKIGSASGSGREEDILTSTEMLAVLNFCSEQSSHNNTSSQTAYLLHDSGMLVLKTALVNRKNLLVKASQSSSSSLSGGQKASGSHPVSQSAGLEEIDEIILRASVLVAGCWKTLDCEVWCKSCG